MDETDSERNIRLGREVGATVVAATGTAVGRQEDYSPVAIFKRDMVTSVVQDALDQGIDDPEEIKKLKLEKIEQLKGI